MTTVVVSGALANKYLNGGNAWTRLSWVLGLKKLGFSVYFFEQISRESCVDTVGSVTAFENSVNVAYFKEITKQFGISGSAALVYGHGEETHGLSYADLLDVAEAADLLINIGGHLTLEKVKHRFRRKVYFDDDPAFTQFWHAGGNPGPHLEDHDFYFTVGEHIGRSTCLIPTGGIRWRPTRPPVVLEDWPVSSEGDRDRFTTIATWRGPYGPVQYGSRTFGLKVHEFRKFITLPERASQAFEIALNIHPADEKDLNLLYRHGWQLVTPKVIVPDPCAFRRYVQTSGAEFSVAQGIYVETESGWFSDRTVRYLASGKPALVQDTGFSRNYPVGDGLVPFRTLDQAVASAERVSRDYDGHCRAARALAEEYFDSDKVLGQLIDEVDIAP